MPKDDIYTHDESTGTTADEEDLTVFEHSRKYRSKWNCGEIKGPLWPMEGFSRGNDIY